MRVARGLVAVAALVAMAGCGGGSTSSAPNASTSSARTRPARTELGTERGARVRLERRGDRV